MYFNGIRSRYTKIETPFHNIVTCRPISRQRVAKHIPGVTLSTTEGYLFGGNDSVNTSRRNEYNNRGSGVFYGSASKLYK
jgi:hypothetical protein